MSFKEYLKENYSEDSLDYNTVNDIVASDLDMFARMGQAGLTLKDFENNTRKYFDFIIKHLEELKKKHHFKADQESLEQDWALEYGNKNISTDSAWRDQLDKIYDKENE